MTNQNDLPPPMQCTPEKTCAQMMKEAINAYHELTIDGGVSEVSSMDETTKWHKADIGALKTHIQTLHATCPTVMSAAILGMNQRRSAMSVCYGNSSRCSGGRC